MTFPVPLQSGQFLASIRPLPRQRRHRFSPVPDVPGDASSPGFAGSDLGPHRPHAGCWALRRHYRAPGSRSVRRARRAVVPLAHANRPPRRRCRRLHAASEHLSNDACQDIARAGGGGRQPDTAAAVEPRFTEGGHKPALRAFHHHDASVPFGGPLSWCQRIRFDRASVDAQEPGYVVGMRRDHRAIDPRLTARRGRP